jgi:hypothetical protein
MFYYVESIGKGNKKGINKNFKSLVNAKKFARQELSRGRAVAIDKITERGQSPIAQKNMKITGFKNKKFFIKDFGKL